MTEQSLSHDLQKFFNQLDLSDTLITFNGAQFHGHSFLLCARSKALQLLIQQQPWQDGCVSVCLDRLISPNLILLWGKATMMSSIEYCLKYIYTDEFDVGHATPSLVYCARLLGLKGLLSLASPIILTNLNAENSLYTWIAVGDSQECKLLVMQNFYKLFDTNPSGFGALSQAQMISLLQEDGLAIGDGGEDSIWELVCIWAKQQASKDGTNIGSVLAESNVLPYVKYPLLSIDTLKAIQNSLLVPQAFLQEAENCSRRAPTPDQTVAAPGTARWRHLPRGQAMPLKPPQVGSRPCSPDLDSRPPSTIPTPVAREQSKRKGGNHQQEPHYKPSESPSMKTQSPKSRRTTSDPRSPTTGIQRSPMPPPKSLIRRVEQQQQQQTVSAPRTDPRSPTTELRRSPTKRPSISFRPPQKTFDQNANNTSNVKQVNKLSQPRARSALSNVTNTTQQRV